jgi:histidine triad (HIT) family protein
VAAPGCPFCAIVAGETSAHLVWRDEHAVCFLDRAPLFHGHVLVVPTRHAETLGDLADDELGPFFRVVRRIATALPAAVDAVGTFVAENNVVSQSVPHLHVHVVPRRPKDGLRGFFWPRTRYPDEATASAIAEKIAMQLQRGA